MKKKGGRGRGRGGLRSKWKKQEAKMKQYTVDSAFNELGYSEISEFLKIHFFKTDFFNKDITMKGDKISFFPGPLNFAK